MVNTINTSMNNNIYTSRKTGSKCVSEQIYQQNQSSNTSDTVKTKHNVSIQDIYERLKAMVSNEDTMVKQDCLTEECTQTDSAETVEDSDDTGFTVYYQGVPLENWALTDPKYTDPETGISWYVRDGKYPYMVGEDAENFQKLCKESGEFSVKKFAEMTGLIRQLDDNTIAYIGDNGIAVESKDGKELFVDTSHLSYDIVMNMFNNLTKTDDYFDSNYWLENIQKAQNIWQ